MTEQQFQIKGMTCASCVNTVEKALKSIPGVKEAYVNLATEKALVILDASVKRDTIEAEVKKAGYEVIFGAQGDAEFRAQTLRNQVVLSGMLTLPLLHPFSLPFWVQFGLATLVQFGFGMGFYRGAFAALRNRTGNMDLLIALGTTSAFILSFIGHHPYFESAASIITLVKLGKWLELRAKAKTTKSIKALESLKPTTARLQFGTQEFETPISGIKIGDRMVVLPGERVPLDGAVIEGKSEVDESFLTGESQLIYKEPGLKVIGGSINAMGRLVVRVSNLGSDTLLSRVIRLIEDANAKKAPIQKLVDRVAAVFVPIVVLIALLTLVLYFWVHGRIEEEAFVRAISVLVIACPCALGLATPTAMMVGTGLAARHGILIRDPDALEQAHLMKWIAIDKTGTLTEGKPKLIEWKGADRLRALGIAAAIQTGSEHPLAKAILLAAQENDIDLGAYPSTSHRTLPGLGIEASVLGENYALGSERLLKTQAIPIPPATEELGTRSFLVHLGSQKIEGVFLFQDEIKTGARKFIQGLQELGLRVVILSGDRSVVVESVARSLEVLDFKGELMPEEKAQVIFELQRKGEVVGMIGDGVNDAPSLAAANVGIALSTGTDVAMQTAGITLMGSDPGRALEAIEISRKTYSRIRQNLTWAFIYNGVCIPLAASGMLSPTLAGAAMALSSVSVVLNSLRR